VPDCHAVATQIRYAACVADSFVWEKVLRGDHSVHAMKLGFAGLRIGRPVLTLQVELELAVPESIAQTSAWGACCLSAPSV